jgi:hypothetical protein
MDIGGGASTSTAFESQRIIQLAAIDEAAFKEYEWIVGSVALSSPLPLLFMDCLTLFTSYIAVLNSVDLFGCVKTWFGNLYNISQLFLGSYATYKQRYQTPRVLKPFFLEENLQSYNLIESLLKTYYLQDVLRMKPDLRAPFRIVFSVGRTVALPLAIAWYPGRSLFLPARKNPALPPCIWTFHRCKEAPST